MIDKTQVFADKESLIRYWHNRDLLMLSDRSRIHLAKPVPVKGQMKWVLNEPKVLFDTCVSLMSAYQPRFRLPLSINFTPEDQSNMNKSERFLLGIFRSLDDRQRRQGKSYWLRELAFWVASGWYAPFVHIEKKDNGEIQFRCDLFDPITCYPEWDANGLATFVRTYQVDKRTAFSMAESWGKESEFKPDEADTTITVINYWKNMKGEVYNCVYLGDTELKELTIEPFDEIPIFIGTVGSPERVDSDDNSTWQQRVGENIIAANRDNYDYMNSMVSLMAQSMAETAYPEKVTTTDTGEPAVKAEDIRGFGNIIPLKTGETLEAFKHAATPAEVNMLISMLGQTMQRGGLPSVVYGGLAQELSGFAISQLMASIKYKLSPYLNTMEMVISAIATEFLRQYKEGHYGKVSLPAVSRKSIDKGQFFIEDFTREDVPEVIYVDVNIPLTSPLDKTQQIMFARQALAPPQLMSRKTLWDEVLDVQDSEQEYARIIEDQSLELPIMKQIAIMEDLRIRAQALRDENKPESAKALEKYIQMLEMQLSGGSQKPATQTGGTPGTPSNVMPAEAGSPSPDALRSVLGVSPPGLSRAPQTPEQRATSKQGVPQ